MFLTILFPILQNDLVVEPTIPPTNHDRLDNLLAPPPQKSPIIQKVYYSYFERANDKKDEIKYVVDGLHVTQN